MSNLRQKLHVLFIVLMLGIVTASAQTIRYVKIGGDNTKDGTSWATAKADIQAAINDLVTNNLYGEVWVAVGKYYPTETTDESSSPYYKSFKIPAGITVRGGFKGDETAANERPMKDDKNFGKTSASGTLDGESSNGGVYYWADAPGTEKQTILCGDLLAGKSSHREWDEKKEQFNYTFYGNSYHVVWFAMGGFDANGRALPLSKPAKLEGCVVEGGHAYTRNASPDEHPHMGYGGGIYMVANSFVYNCEVKDCDASRNGGGIYMDGGGIVRRTYVHDCQALGLGTDFGFGGGICEDGAKHNSKANPVVVAQSVVTNCVGRMGGGMALVADQTVGNNKYTVVVNSTVVNNNTAQVEAGGVYTHKGGGLASTTVVNNKCNGSGITQNGVITGRAGGVYSRDASYIGNTVIWGNKCEANKDMQYANSRSSLADEEKSKFLHSALSNADVVDWSTTERMNVVALETENSTETATNSNKGYALFKKPTPATKEVEGQTVSAAGYYPEAVTGTDWNWSVYSESALTYAGINTADLDKEGLTPAPTGKQYDMQFGQFNSRPTIGALISEVPTIEPNTEVANKQRYFVDPNFIYSQNNTGSNGVNWTHPARFLGSVLDHVKTHPAGAGTEVIIYVKEGTVDNTRYNTGDDRVRTTSLEIPSNVTILGSYDARLTGTDVNESRRNPVLTPTVISGKLLDDYKYNVAHLITIDSKENITIDGFKITFANASSELLGNDDVLGAAITLKNCYKQADQPTIHFKNIIVSNCQAERGAVVYSEKSAADFENCIFHNNSLTRIDHSGLIHGVLDSDLRFDHCDVVRNVGNASYLDEHQTVNKWTNTIFYGNMDRRLTDTNTDAGGGIGFALPAFSGSTTNATGSYCMFDNKSAEFASQFGGNDTGNQWQYNLQYAFIDGTGQGYPRFVNPTKNAGITEDGDATYYGRAVSYEPHNNNPVVNSASYTDSPDTWGVDLVGVKRTYGGLPDIGAMESHKMEPNSGIINANIDGQMPYGAVIYVRDYNATGTNVQTYDRHVDNNGTPDDVLDDKEIFTENNEGKGLYIKEGENYFYLGGNSWRYAINGNADYTGSESKDGNTTWKAVGHGGETVFKGFKIKSGNRYLSLNGNNLTTTNNVDQATVWTVGNVTTGSGISTGPYSIGANGRYITITGSGNNRTLTTSGSAVNLTLTGSSNNFTIYYNGRYVRLSNNNSLSASTTSTTWNFVGVSETTPATYTEAVYETNTQQVTPGVAADDVFTATQKLHVYHSKEDVDNIQNHPYTGTVLKTFKLGSNGGGNNYAYTVDGNANVMKSTTTKGSADEFVLIAADADDKYYIYNTTRNKYVYYTATSQSAANAKTVLLDANIAGKNATWWVIEDNTNNCLYIKPGTLARNADISWNYYGGTGNELGLAATQWGDSKWKATAVAAYEVYKTTTQVETNVIGLQYAVNNAHNAMQRVSVKEEKDVTEKFGSLDKTVKHTYYHFTPTDDQPEISVYVGAGVYTQDRKPTEDAEVKGFLIRNHVKVYGAFPANGTPGMNERHAQLSVGIKGASAAEVKPYETILQTNKTKPVVGGSGYIEANVLSHPRECKVTTADDSNEPRSRVVYEDCLWDGFTMRYGYYHGVLGGGGGRRWSGAGVALYENVTLRNCVVRDNLLVNGAGRAAGIYCDGSTIQNCYLLDNESACPNENFGGGIYMIQGTMFNTVIAGNRITGGGGCHGAGIFIESAKFYNNTIVNNTGGSAIGIYTASKASADLIVYNSIVIAGSGEVPLWRQSDSTPAEFVHCYIKSDAADGTGQNALIGDNDDVIIRDDQKYVWDSTNEIFTQRKRNNKIYLNSSGINPDGKFTYAQVTSLSEGYNPFLKSYTDAVAQYDYRISSTTEAFNCVNAGTDFLGKYKGVDLEHAISYDTTELPDYDMDWDDRVQDCKVDIGAYECNGSANISPQMFNESGNVTTNISLAKQLVFYVSPFGFGDTSAKDPENAACAPKLQRVIDAAGRYKFAHPEMQVIVKVANNYEMYNAAIDYNKEHNLKPGDTGYKEPESFTYYATRTTDWMDQDVRVWSIIIPRGVEVWGGYTDVPVDANWEKTTGTWTNTHNGFVKADGKTDNRNITKNPTYFDSYYYNKEQKSDANTYHVVSFSDRVFDPNGLAYLKGEEGKVATGEPSAYVELSGNDESLFLHMSEEAHITGNVITDNSGNAVQINGKYASNRAVLDGIFVSGGIADGKAVSGSATLNINGYGGAAIVTDYAYVRNCIVTNNYATNGGGLALTNGALVSGSLIMHNNAENHGGGLYVFEEGTQLSNGTTIKSLKQDGDPSMDYRMAHVLTSTIVANYANIDGGGVWYDNSGNANARFNSVAIWQNNSKGQANVFGSVHPEQPTDDETLADEYYPFAYSVIQNIRASGTNNISAEPLNRQGVRFVKKDHDFGQDVVDLYYMAEETSETDLEGKYSDFGYYGLTTYSILCSNGMPAVKYNELKKAIAIADDDILAKERVHAGNQFVEVGARSLAKELPKKQLMLRLFVANPEDVDTETAGRFMRLSQKTSPTKAEEYYSQEGSSFAYPFNFLQDALDYVKEARNNTLGVTGGTAEAYDLPFEILVAKGTYWPKQDLNGGTISVWSHTFAIPEGVTIIGGFNPQGGGTGSYYGRYNKPKSTINHTAGTDGVTKYIDDNVEPIPTDVHQHSTNDIGRGYRSGEETVTLPDASTVTFQQWDIQDIADRRAMNDNNKNGIIEPWEFKNQTIISGNAVNGETDGVYHIMTAVADADAVGKMPTAGYDNSSKFEDDGYHWYEYGQQIRLNGLIITGGNGLTYLKTALDEYGKYIYYQGAGLQVDGNRYNPTVGGIPVFHNSAAYGVGYRDIPVSIVNCQFRNNIAGYGGAISTNGTLDTFASSFEQNLAVAQTEKPKPGETWTTDVDPLHPGQPVTMVMYPGQGGAILATGQVSCYNTLFANNEARTGANDTPTIDLVKHPTFRVPNKDDASPTLRAAGGAIMVGSAGRYHMMNCDFVRNKANAYPVIFTMNPNSTEDEKGILEKTSTENYNQIVSTVVWGNEVNKVTNSNEYYDFASKMMVNVGKKEWTGAEYTPKFVEGNVPSSQDDLDKNWKEFVWFSAYEDGVGFTTNNKYDLRDHIIFKTGEFVNWNIKAAAKEVDSSLPDITSPEAYFQNCNIQIVAENEDVAGPNFGIPSVKAGYDGFMEGADWSPARINRLTDNGSGWIKQSVDPATLKVTFDDKTDSPNPAVKNQHYQGGYPVAHYDTWPEYKLWLAIGNEKYMQATSEEEEGDVYINDTKIVPKPQKNLPRISPDPTKGVEKAYIDIGVYEYQKQAMVKPGSEVDILWVSTEEHPENGPATGATWKTPTSDLQRAIETLLSSRNGHKKEIRLMEGEYAPINTKSIDGTNYSAFVIDTKSLNGAAITPSDFVDGSNNEKYYAQSITIKGGYSKDIIYENDPAQYKTIIRQNKNMDGANTDHLIYIADPTVRYAGTTGVANDNATVGSTGEASQVRTMPVQVDGVTLINDNANTNVNGSAIYYPDYDGTSAPQANVKGAHTTSVGGIVVYYDSKTEMEKVDAKGNHIGLVVNYETEFAIVGGTVDYYETAGQRDQVDSDNKHTGTKVTGPTEFAVVYADGISTVSDTKLLVTKTIVVGSGNKSDNKDNASAVYIGKKGGAALIYNSVFHSNYGMPLDAWNTINVNNTFGKNKGLVRLQDDDAVTVNSKIHNSALWKNNGNAAQFSMPNVSVETTEGDTKGDVSGTGIANFTYNSFTGGNIMYADYDSGSGHVAGNHYNTGISDNNKDLANGPNFVDPENDDIFARNFDIRPSVRLLNKGNGTRTPGTPDTYGGLYNTLVVSSKYDFALISSTDKDVLSRMRIVSEGSPQKIDVGAYEFQGTLQQVLYVDPNKTHRDEATGENWDKSFGYGDLQDAVDLAGIYHMNNKSAESYVFVKGNSSTNTGKNTNETLTIRDGVTVYGSIIDGYTDWHDIQDPADPSKPKYRKEDGHGGWVYDIEQFIADMTFNREGVASNAASKTIVTGIKTSEYTAFDGKTQNTPALVDGFVVTDPTPATTPVLDVTNTSEDAVIVVRNVVVADNTIDNSATGTDVNVAQISNGLIYEALFRDNKPKGNGAVLKVSNNPDGAYSSSTTTSGYAVNVTVEGRTVGADGSVPVDGKVGDVDFESSSQIFKSITNSINSGSGANKAGAAAPYGQITNPGISGYFYNIADPNLNYQLTETSKYIDMCETDMVTTEGKYKGYPNFLPDNLKKFINYNTDRDLLGNPRWMRNVSSLDKIDRGAFETWRVDNDFVCGKWEKVVDSDTWYGTNKSLDPAIAQHFYPHDGSVVYVMENKNLVIDPLGDHDVKATPENPGFLLVKKGANFYGNGRPVTAAYVAIERDVRKGGSIVAVPYAMNYGNEASVAKVEKDVNNDLVLNMKNGSRANKYNGIERMDWKYIFQTTNTQCWDQISEATANQGVLFEPYGGTEWYPSGDENTTALLRFTGKGNGLTDYIYRENGVSKDVTLTKYDDSESTRDGADYTDEKDMGWNCFGIPYLVSNYKPYEKVSVTDTDRNIVEKDDEHGDISMDIAHVLWLYYDGTQAPDGTKTKPTMGDGGYYNVNSWDITDHWHMAPISGTVAGDDAVYADPALWVGEGIFTQTATLQDTEALKFYLPVAPTSFPDPSSAKSVVRYYYDGTGIEETVSSDDVELIGTEYYTVDGLRIERPRRGQVVIIRNLYSNGSAKTSKMFVK